MSEVKLTPRETEIIHQISEGNTSREIAEKLYISVETVECHRGNIIRKLKCRNITHAIATLLRGRLIL